MRHTRITSDLNTTAFMEAVAADLDVPIEEARAAVYAVFNTITRATAGGHNVTITNFGTFRSVRVPRRMGYNPQTGEKIWVAAHQVVRFRVSDALADLVRRGCTTGSIRKLGKGATRDGRRGRS